VRHGAGGMSFGAASFILLQVLGLVLASPPRAQPAGDARRGERQFQRCFACHSVDPDEKGDLQGPSLYRVVGRKAGAVEGFAYSSALARRAAEGLVWTEDALNKLMTDPEAFVPGTRMAFPGVSEPRERADIIAYLKAAAR
jgi:cytochrome c